MAPHPYSPSDEDLGTFEEIIGYHFRGRVLAREALQITNALPGEGNKSLALFGEAVHRMILIWQGRQKDESECKQINHQANRYQKSLTRSCSLHVVSRYFRIRQQTHRLYMGC